VVVIILLVVVGVFGAGGYVGSDQAIGNKSEWRKMVHSPAEYNLSSETVALQSTDGIPLKAWWLPAQQEDAGTRGAGVTQAGTPESLPAVNVILVHGRDMNRSGMLSRAAFLVRHNYNVLDLDLRAHGESGGNYITPGYREAFDVMGGVAHIRSRGEHGPIVVLGYSYGAVAALHAAAECPEINAVISDSPFITPDDVLKNVAHRCKTRPEEGQRNCGSKAHSRSVCALHLRATGLACAAAECAHHVPRDAVHPQRFPARAGEPQHDLQRGARAL